MWLAHAYIPRLGARLPVPPNSASRQTVIGIRPWDARQTIKRPRSCQLQCAACGTLDARLQQTLADSSLLETSAVEQLGALCVLCSRDVCLALRDEGREARALPGQSIVLRSPITPRNRKARNALSGHRTPKTTPRRPEEFSAPVASSSSRRDRHRDRRGGKQLSLAPVFQQIPSPASYIPDRRGLTARLQVHD